MISSKSTQRYAQALFDLCQKDKTLDQVYEDSKSLISVIDQSPELRGFLQNPVIPSAQKEKILKEMFESKVHSASYRFILFLEQKKRLPLLKNILTIFEELYLEYKNVLKVTLTSRWELTKEEVQSITHYLKSKFQKDILPQFKINTDILGGIKIQMGDIVYDYTLATQLKKFKDSIIWS